MTKIWGISRQINLFFSVRGGRVSAWLMGLVLLLSISPATLMAQNMTLAKAGIFSIRGTGATFYTTNFYQTSSASSLKMYEGSAISIGGDSVVCSGTWSQEASTQVFFTPKFSSSTSLYSLVFTASANAVFRNISFSGITNTSAKGLILRERSRKILQIGGNLNMPVGMPIFLGSNERANVEDYIKDTNFNLTLEIYDSVRYINLGSKSFIVTSSRSVIEDSIAPNQTASFPVAYNSSHFTPVQIENPSEGAVFRVSAVRSYYDWYPGFKSTQDEVDKSNIKPAGVDVMWTISSKNSNVKANVYTQISKNSSLFQKAFVPDPAMLTRYVYAANNDEGTANSKTFWDNASTAMNIPYTIFPNVLTSSQVYALKRDRVDRFDKYSIFTLTSFYENDAYPLSTVLPAAQWISGTIEPSPFTSPPKQLHWTLSGIARVDSFRIYASKVNVFNGEDVFIGSVQASSELDYTSVLPTTLLGKKSQLLYYKIVPLPISPSDTLIYKYVPYVISPETVVVTSSKASATMMNNPYSLTMGDPIECLITPSAGGEVTKMTISLISATAHEKVIFQEDLDEVSNEAVTITLDPLLHGLYAGHYILIAQIEYASSPTEKVYTKFSIY